MQKTIIEYQKPWKPSLEFNINPTFEGCYAEL